MYSTNRKSAKVSNSLSSSSSYNSFSSSEVPHSPLLGSFRVCIVTMLMLCLFCATSLRMNLGMAIVCMVNSTDTLHTVSSSQSEHFPGENNIRHEFNQSYEFLAGIDAATNRRCYGKEEDNTNNLSDYQGTLLWSPVMQSQLFSAVAYGSITTIWLSGFLADRFGPKHLMALTLADSVIVGFLSPWLATHSYTSFFIARLIMGFGEGFIYPSLSTTAARWFPPQERSRMAAYFTIGNQIASVIGFLVSSRLCSLSFLGGWPLIFYTFSFVGLIVLICWLIFVTDGPQGNRFMSDDERRYILASTSSQFLPDNASRAQIFAAANAEQNRSRPTRLTTQPIPWRQVATSRALWAIIVAQAGFNLTAVIFQSYLPTYLKEVLRVDLKLNGVLSIIPFGVQLISKMIYGILSDWLKRRKTLTATQAVKLFQLIGSYGCSLVFLGLAFFVDCTRLPAAIFFLFCYGLMFSAGICGFYTSMLSIAPAFTGLVTSISTFFGIVSNALGPTFVALIHNTWRELRGE